MINTIKTKIRRRKSHKEYLEIRKQRIYEKTVRQLDEEGIELKFKNVYERMQEIEGK